MKRIASSVLAALLALPTAAAAQSLEGWNYDQLYENGISVEEMLDGMDVNGKDEQDIGEVEDVLIGPDGRVVALIAEVGGFWDMGDSHISIPWEKVDAAALTDGINLPIDEDTAGDYSLFDRNRLTQQAAKGQVVSGVDSADTGAQLWRASDLIGDYARVRKDDGEGWVDYGYISDLIIRDGQVAAVVVTPDVGWGYGGYRAYPYDGVRDRERGEQGMQQDRGSGYYNMPFTVDELDKVEVLDYDRFAY